MAALVSMSNLLNGKDSRWLQLEVCREFQRNKCSRPDTECKFAHPPANVEVQNGRVTACYDSIKGRCNREKPPCKYFHPPQHLKDQLLINGRNHLALKNALMQQMGMAPPASTPTILPSPLQPMTANRFVSANNPSYLNPYFGPGIMPIQIGTEHATTALASSSLPQAMSIASNNGTQPQKRTDRVQMDQMKFMGPYYENFPYPGLLPYKRPAPDHKGYPMYQPSAAAYQQLMQLQSQPYAVTSHQNSKVTPSNNIEHNMLSKNAVVINAAASSPDDGDSENALPVQNAKLVGLTGCDESTVASSTSSVENNDDTGQSVTGDALLSSNGSEPLALLQKNHVDDVTQSSLQSPIDENNLNANGFISTTSSSLADRQVYTTSSITNNNNSILSRKNSLTTPNQLSINSSKASMSYTNTPSTKVDTVPDYLSASTHNNHPQAALFSAMLYPPYQQLALTQNLYTDPAQMAKEMAQKNYANAFKYAMVQQNSGAATKTPMSAMPYSGVALSANNNPMLQPSSMGPVGRSPYLPTLTRPMQSPMQQFVRPQMPVNLTATNPYFAAAAHQQFLNQQNMLYPGLTSSLTTQQITATSGASTPTPYATSSYPYALSPAQAQAMNAQSLQGSMMQVPQMASQQSQTGGSNVVLNPYKKMKTS